MLQNDIKIFLFRYIYKMMGNAQNTKVSKSKRVVVEEPVQEPEPEVVEESEPVNEEEVAEESEVVEEPDSNQGSPENPLLKVPVADKNASFQLLIAFINLAFSRGAYTKEEVEKIIECINMFTV
jgi:hypothetical protein